MRPNTQRKSEIEGVTALTSMCIRFIAQPRRLVGNPDIQVQIELKTPA